MIQDNWYEDFFQGISVELWSKVTSPEWTQAEVDFLWDVLNLKAGNKALDIPCGNGRHSIGLAEKGVEMVAVDISPEFIALLKTKLNEQSLSIKPILGNIIEVDLPIGIDAAFCMGNSFGYFTYPDMKTFISKVAQSLTSGGRFVINSGMVAESILPNFSDDETFQVEDIEMRIQNTYHENGSYMECQLTYTRNETIEYTGFKHHVYTLGEIQRLLSEVGLKTTAVYSSTEKKPFKLGDHQMYLVAEKGGSMGK